MTFDNTTQGADQQPETSRCHLTGLPILSLSAFDDIHMKGDYYISCKKIGDSIVLVEGKGNFGNYDIEQFDAIIEEFCVATEVKMPYVQIRDATQMKGRISLRTMQKQSSRFLDQQNTIAAVITINDPFWLSLFVKHSVRFFSPSIRFISARNYDEAIAAAVKALEKESAEPETRTLESANQKIHPDDILFSPLWAYENKQTGFTYKIGVMPAKIIFSQVEGAMSTIADSAGAVSLIYKVNDRYPLSGKAYNMVDLTNVYGKTPIHVQKAFASALKKLWDTPDDSFDITHIVVTQSRFFRVAGRLFFALLRQKVLLAADKYEAFDMINRMEETKKDFSYEHPKIVVSRSDFDEITHACSYLLWDEKGEGLRVEVSPDNPLFEVAEMIEMVRNDLNQQKHNEIRKNQERLYKTERNRKRLLSMMEDNEAAKEALIKEEESKRILLDNINLQVWYLTDETTYGAVNKAHADFKGMRPEDMAFKSFYQVYTQEITEQWKQSNAKVFSGKETITSQRWVPNAQGEPRFISVTKIPKLKPDGTVEYVVCSAEDITQRMRDEEKILNTQSELTAILENTLDSIWSIDEKYEIIYINEVFESAFKQAFGVKLTPGRNILEALPKSIRPIWKDRYDRALSGERLVFVDKIEAHGQSIHIEVAANPIIKHGKITGASFFGKDITEQSMAEETKRQLQIAQKTVKFKQNFLANMSHEIRTPLTGVMGMVEILENTNLDSHQKDYVHALKTSGRHLKEIIDQVLDYSKIEAGKLTLRLDPFDFASIARDAVLLYKNNAAIGVEIKNIHDPEIPSHINSDRFRLSQILNNLVSNAVKFTTQGLITIQSSLKSSNAQNGQVVIKVEVSDTGLGIPEDLQKKLFVPFSQIGAEDTRNYEGTGLGLSICKELVKMMDGEIGMLSEPGKGSTFWFTFPAQTAQEPALAKQNEDTSVSAKKLHILLAEDKVVNQKVVKLMLSSMGHEVTIANNGQEALDLYQPDHFDLILMDIQMPVMDGVTATQKLKEKYQSLSPIIGLSANAFEGDREKYMAQGMDEYLTKPVKKDDFEGLMGRLFQ